MAVKSPEQFDIAQALAAQSEHARYFDFCIETRFADFICGGQLHCSKQFEFFEMARFDVLQQYEQFLAREGYDALRTEAHPVFFVVAKTDYTNIRPVTRAEKVLVRTRLIVQNIPVLEFHQALLQANSSHVCAEAVIKIAIVDENMATIRNWTQSIQRSMLMFVLEEWKGVET